MIRSKVVVVGDWAVGKTSIVQQILGSGTAFPKVYRLPGSGTAFPKVQYIGSQAQAQHYPRYRLIKNTIIFISVRKITDPT